MEKELPMPDISDLDSLKEPLLVILIGLNDKGLTQNLGLHRRNFIRLVDKAIIEYLDARQELVKEIKEEKRALAGQQCIDSPSSITLRTASMPCGGC